MIYYTYLHASIIYHKVVTTSNVPITRTINSVRIILYENISSEI